MPGLKQLGQGSEALGCGQGALCCQQPLSPQHSSVEPIHPLPQSSAQPQLLLPVLGQPLGNQPCPGGSRASRGCRTQTTRLSSPLTPVCPNTTAQLWSCLGEGSNTAAPSCSCCCQSPPQSKPQRLCLWQGLSDQLGTFSDINILPLAMINSNTRVVKVTLGYSSLWGIHIMRNPKKIVIGEMGKRKNVMAGIFIHCVRRVKRRMGFSTELWGAPAGPALDTVGVTQGRAWPQVRGFTQVPAKAAHCAHYLHHTSTSWGAGPSTFLLNPIIPKPLQLQLNKTKNFPLL